MPQAIEEFRTRFNTKLDEIVDNKGISSRHLTKNKYKWIMNRLDDFLKNPEMKKTSQDYRLLKRFEILETIVDGVTTKKLKHCGTDRIYVTVDELFDVIHTEHLSTGHGARDVSHNKTSELFANVSKEMVQLYVDMCETCNLKKNKIRKSLVVKPIVSNALNSRCQLDLIDMQSQPDDGYKYILNYQDHLTKFVILRPLKTKRKEEVAYQVVDIFCLLGAPHVLQSDNGREFANKVVKEILEMWPGCKLVHGKPRHSQSQGSVERANQDVEGILACWMKENDTTHWADGLRFVQWQKNNRVHSGIGRSPYNAMFGENRYVNMRAANLPNEVWARLETEEQLAEALNIETQEDRGEVVDNDVNIIVQSEGDIDTSIINNRSANKQNICNVCEREYKESIQCRKCSKFCHEVAPCSVTKVEGTTSFVICQLCEKNIDMGEQRRGAHLKQVKQADKMLSAAAKRFKPASVGDSVSVPIPEVDRGRAEFRNVLGVVTNVDNGGTYSIGTSHGTLKQRYARSQFIPSIGSFLEVDAVPDGEVTLREVARKDSIGSGQGFISCTCASGCDTKRCGCKKSNRLCNSKCHSSLNCKNK